MGLLSKVQSTAPRQPSRVVLYGSEGFGKTSFAAYAPNPLFLMTQGETGLLSLLEAARVRPVDYLPECVLWDQLERGIVALTEEDHKYSTVVIDTANGAELSLAESIRNHDFGGDHGSYDKYGRGAAILAVRWAEFLARLDRLRLARNVAVILLHHCQIRAFSDPAGKDWDQYQPQSAKQCWSLTHKWADVILFGGYRTEVSKDEKAVNSRRYLRTEAGPAIVAKNRYGLPAEIMPSRPGAEAMWSAFADSLRAAKAKGAAAAQQPPAEPPAPESSPEEPSVA